MKVWRIYAPDDIREEEITLPVGEKCIKIKVMYTSFSQSDDLIFRGKLPVEFPVIPCRSCIGMVSEVGADVRTLSRGDIVAVKPFSACGNCAACKQNKFYNCEHKLNYGINEDGFLRDFAVVNASDAIKLPDSIGASKDAVFLEHIDMCISAINRLSLDKGQYLVIMGATDMGLILAQIAMYYQAVPIVVDVRQELLEKAKKFDIYYTVNSMEVDANRKILSLTGGKMADAVAYMTASTLPLTQALGFIKRGGTAVMVGWANTSGDLSYPYAQILDKQLTICGISGSNNNYYSAVNVLANKAVRVSELIGDVIEKKDVPKYLKDGGNEKHYLKTVIKCSDF